MTLSTPAVDAGTDGPLDRVLRWRRPALAAVSVIAPAALLALIHPAAALVVLLPAAVVAWRLRGSGLQPWLPHPVDHFPNTVTDPRLRRFAADLRWRWEHGMVVGGLGAYDDDGTYAGAVLSGVSQHGDGVVAHARLPHGVALHDVHAHTSQLAAGLEAAEVSVLGGEQGTVALLVHERQPDEGWT